MTPDPVSKNDDSTADAGALLREARARAGLSQRRLAIRAGTSQDRISRIERGQEQPSLRGLNELLMVMGQEARVALEPLEPRQPRRLTPDDLTGGQRLELAASWNRFASLVAAAGERDRRQR